MGAHAYWYFTNYDPDHEAALQSLRRREFLAGRYNPVLRFIDFPIDASGPSPGAKHASITQAIQAAGADGTRSILDVERTGPDPDFGVAGRLDDATLIDLYDTTEPTHEVVEATLDVLDSIDRGQAIYIVVYRGGQPDELFFAGYSYD